MGVGEAPGLIGTAAMSTGSSRGGWPHCLSGDCLLSMPRICHTVSAMSKRVRTDTKLGQRIAFMGYTVTRTCEKAHVHPRTMTDYLSGKDRIRPHHAVALARALACEPEDITG